MRLTGHGIWGEPRDPDEARRVLRRAIELDVNFIDTADSYGPEVSERLIAETLRPYPASLVIATKGGLLRDGPDVWRPDGRPSHLRQALEGSLKRLGLERIDLYQFHWPDETGTPVEESWAELLRLRDEGKVRAIGVSNFTVELLERSEALGHVDSLQPPFSLINRSAGGNVIPWSETHGTGVIVYSPMQSGLLSGRFSAERVAGMPKDDWRRRNAEFTEPKLARNLALVEWLRPIAYSHGVSVGAVAIAWTLAWPGVTGAIVGARSPEQVDGWISAARVRLTDPELDSIAAALQATSAGQGPVAAPALVGALGS
jgi:aryl-alcohol dehydrogenase-like predicted oxidoreductase